MKGLNDMEKRMIEEKAKEILKEHHTGTGFVDVVEIAKKVGFIIFNALLDDVDDGFIIVSPEEMELFGENGTKFIGFNSDRNIERKRFILAHELGHYFLHYNDKSILYAMREDKKGKNEEEQDVDYFAACLLMPEDAFRNKVEELKNKKCSGREIIAVLKDFFGVEEVPVTRRIEELKLSIGE